MKCGEGEGEQKKLNTMGRHTSILYQIVYSTKHRTPCLAKKVRPRIFQHLHGILKNNKCHTYRINGVEDHLHILMDLHPTIALSNLIKDLKLGSSDFIKRESLIDNFSGWQVGYGAFTYTRAAKHHLIEYIKNQEQHHQAYTFKEEYIGLLKEHQVEYDLRFVFE